MGALSRTTSQSHRDLTGTQGGVVGDEEFDAPMPGGLTKMQQLKWKRQHVVRPQDFPADLLDGPAPTPAARAEDRVAQPSGSLGAVPARAATSPSAPMHYVAAHAFDPCLWAKPLHLQRGQAGCIALAAGEAVVVTDNSRDDWWQGFRTAEPGKLGSFPKAYVQPAPAAAAVAAPAADSGAQAALHAEYREWKAKQAAEAEAEEQKAVADAAKRAEQAEHAERAEAPAVTGGGAASAEETGWVQQYSEEHRRRYAASPTSTSHACCCFKQTCLLRTAPHAQLLAKHGGSAECTRPQSHVDATCGAPWRQRDVVEARLPRGAWTSVLVQHYHEGADLELPLAIAEGLDLAGRRSSRLGGSRFRCRRPSVQRPGISAAAGEISGTAAHA